MRVEGAFRGIFGHPVLMDEEVSTPQKRNISDINKTSEIWSESNGWQDRDAQSIYETYFEKAK